MTERTVKRAKTLTDGHLRSLLHYIRDHSPHPLRDRAMVLLTFRAGLRAHEVASLSWANLTDARNKLRSDFIEVVGKRGKARMVPLHHDLFSALLELRKAHSNTIRPMYAARGGYMSANHVTVHLWMLFRDAGFQGASSHSGRRTLLTQLARRANNYDCSLRDVQKVAGHARLDTTEAYIEPTEQVSRLVRSLKSTNT